MGIFKGENMKNLYLEVLENTPIGPITIAYSDEGVLVIEIGRDISGWTKAFERNGFIITSETAPFSAAPALKSYFSGERHDFDIQIDWSLTTAFQKTVMEAVSDVPYGTTSTYSVVARKIGNPKAVRAVGRANATNPLTIVLPCHRLIGADGALRGYRAPEGIITKAWLIDFERQNTIR